jgi:ABC-type xylose transport system permease subunit
MRRDARVGDLKLPGALRRPGRRARLGRLRRSLYAIGGDVGAARAAGIRTDRVLGIVVVVGGLLDTLVRVTYGCGAAALPSTPIS